MAVVAGLPARLVALNGDTSKYAAAVADFCFKVGERWSGSERGLTAMAGVLCRCCVGCHSQGLLPRGLIPSPPAHPARPLEWR